MTDVLFPRSVDSPPTPDSPRTGDPSRTVDRRRFLGAAAALAGGAALAGPLSGLTARAALASQGRLPQPTDRPYGPLRPVSDTTGRGLTLGLPAGFAFAAFGLEGDVMSDGTPTPRAHDGMAAFWAGPGRTRLVRNHEDRDAADVATVKGDPRRAYDVRAGGGTSTLEVRTRPDGSFAGLAWHGMSINGTHVNCAGGPTPWGSWLTCEETTAGPGAGFTTEHGYVFEVPAWARGTVPARPLKAMGRFVHEAVAVDPRTGAIYETEDRGESGFYRFTPKVPGLLVAGGSLAMLKVRGADEYDTRRGQVVGRVLPVEWVPIPDPDPADAESEPLAVHHQGRARGGAIFDRLEGCWYGDGAVVFASTSGGEAGKGQVWQYRPAGRSGGHLTLLFESPGQEVLDNPDNVNITPRGRVLLCEDGDADNMFLRGLTPTGQIFDFCQNLTNGREWCGACWSADGRTLFVNVQGDTSSGGPGDPGLTVAIWGPWGRHGL